MVAEPEPDAVLCVVCGGDGQLLMDGNRIRCPACGGSGIMRTTKAAEKSLSNSAKRWHRRAEEMRTLADVTIEPDMRRILLKLATDFDLMAVHA
jgi:hypothetical protein